MSVTLETLTRVRISEVTLTREYVVLTVGTELPHKVKFRRDQVGDVLVYLLQHPGPAVAYNKATVEKTIEYGHSLSDR